MDESFLTDDKRAEQALRERDAKIRGLFDANIIGIGVAERDGRLIEANDAYLRIVGYDRDDLISGRISWMAMTPPEWINRSEKALSEFALTGAAQPFEKEYFRKDGSRVPVLVGVAGVGGDEDQLVVFFLSLGEREQAGAEARDSERRYREAQADLAHVTRVTTLGELTASIAHEVNQPLAAALANAGAWLL